MLSGSSPFLKYICQSCSGSIDADPPYNALTVRNTIFCMLIPTFFFALILPSFIKQRIHYGTIELDDRIR
jgi:hypothetical protein